MILDQALLLGAGVIAGMLSGIIGTGASVVLLPLLVPMFGPDRAVPIMAIAGLMANAARAIAWRPVIDWRAALVFGLPGIPAAVLGARTFLSMPDGRVESLLGLFMILLMVLRRTILAETRRIPTPALAFAGIVIGYLTGLFLSTGPLSTVAFLSAGLTKGAFIGTEALASLILQIGKLATFRSLGALPLDVAVGGLLLGAALMGGTFASKGLVARFSDRHFRWLMDGVTLCAGLWLLYYGLSGG